MDAIIHDVALADYLSANPQAGMLLPSANGPPQGVYFDRCVLNNRLMFPVTPDLRCFRNEFGIFRDAVYDMVGRSPSPVPLHALENPAPAGKYLGVGGSGNYYHWCLDFLPRLAFQAFIPDGAERRIIIDRNPNAWQAASLRLFMMGLGLETIDLFVNPGEWTSYQDCFVPLPVRQRSVAIWDVVLNRTRAFLPAPSGAKRLFIMRTNADKRFPVNQQDVAAVLESMGFLCIDPGTLSFEQQVALCGDAEIIVGCHGAALTNILFAPAGAVLVELHGSVRQPFFGQLSAMRGLRYLDITCADVADSSRDVIERDYVIPLDALLEQLSNLGVRLGPPVS